MSYIERINSINLRARGGVDVLSDVILKRVTAFNVGHDEGSPFGIIEMAFDHADTLVRLVYEDWAKHSFAQFCRSWSMREDHKISCDIALQAYYSLEFIKNKSLSSHTISFFKENLVMLKCSIEDFKSSIQCDAEKYISIGSFYLLLQRIRMSSITHENQSVDFKIQVRKSLSIILLFLDMSEDVRICY